MRFLRLNASSLFPPGIGIFTDSQTSVRMIRKGILPPLPYWSIVNDIRSTISFFRNRGSMVTIDWIPRSSGTPHHVMADRMAKTAALREYTGRNNDPLTPLSLARQQIARAIDNQSTKWFQSSKRATHFRTITGGKLPIDTTRLLAINSAPRRVQIAWTRLRIGNATTNASLYHMGFSPDPACSNCPLIRDSVSHRILDCPAYSSPRANLQSTLSSINLHLTLNVVVGLDVRQSEIPVVLPAILRFLWESHLANLFCLRRRPTTLPYITPPLNTQND